LKASDIDWHICEIFHEWIFLESISNREHHSLPNWKDWTTKDHMEGHRTCVEEEVHMVETSLMMPTWGIHWRDWQLNGCHLMDLDLDEHPRSHNRTYHSQEGNAWCHKYWSTIVHIDNDNIIYVLIYEIVYIKRLQ